MGNKECWCLTCWSEDGGQRVGMTLLRVNHQSQALEVYHGASVSSRDISVKNDWLSLVRLCSRPYGGIKARQKLLWSTLGK